MSLILEALKKSEQQRRLGEAPTLGSPVVSTRRRRSMLPVLAVLIVIAAGAGWWLTRRPAPPAATPTPPVTGLIADKTAPNAAGATKPVKQAPMTAPAATMQERLKQEAATRKAEQARRGGALGNAKAPLGLPNANGPAMGQRKLGDPVTHAPPPQNVAAPSTTQAPGTAPAQSPLAKGDATVAAPKPGAVTPPAPAAAPGAAPAATTPPAVAKVPAAAPASATSQVAALPTIWELPFSTRKDIPALDLSMHVYSPDPKQRFVVVKGERHAEGDEIAQDLVLREIRQDGLVLEFKGQKFFFPRSGR